MFLPTGQDDETDKLLDLYDRGTELLFCIRNEATCRKYVEALRDSEAVVQAMIEGRVGMPRSRRAFDRYAMVAGKVRGAIEEVTPSGLVADAGTCLQRFSFFLGEVVEENRDSQVWMAPFMAHMTGMAAAMLEFGGRNRAAWTDLEWSHMDAFLASTRAGMTTGLRSVKLQAETTLRRIDKEEVAQTVGQQVSRQLIGRVIGPVNEASSIRKLKVLQVVRRKAEFVKKLAVELESRI